MRNGLPYVEMVPGETLDWSRDWTDVLEDGETIVTSVWDVPVGLTAGLAADTGTYTSQWVTAATLGEYSLVNAMTSSAGRTWLRTLTVAVVAQL